MNIPYSSFCFFNFEKGLISTKTLESTKEFLIQQNFVFEKASADSDLALLNFCKKNCSYFLNLLSDGTSGLVTFYWNAVKGDFPGLLTNPGAPSTPSEGGAQVQGRSRKA